MPLSLADVNDVETQQSSETPRFLPIVDLSQWANATPEPQSWVMDRFIPKGEVTFLTGKGGTNKSTFGLQLCACLAVGRPILGIPVDRMSAMFLTVEDDEREGHWRLAHIARTVGASIEQMQGNLHISILRGRLDNELSTFDAATGRMTPSPTFQLLRDTIEQEAIEFLVLDNVGQLFTGNENDRGQVTRFVNMLYSLCADLGITVLLIAHPNKAGDSYSGSTAWPSAVRCHLFMQYADDEIDPDVRVITTDKTNRGRKGDKIECRWHDFALIVDGDLPPGKQAELASAAQAASDNAIFLKCLAERNRQKRAVSEKPGPNYAPAKFIAMPEAKGLTKHRLESAMDRLFRLDLIRNDFLYRDTQKGRDVHGLIEVPGTPQTPPPNRPQTSPPNAPKPAENRPQIYIPYTTYMEGAAPEAAAPSPTDNGLDGNGDIIGWNDDRPGGLP